MATKAPDYKVVIRRWDGLTYEDWEFEALVDLAYEWYENEVGRCFFKIPWNDPRLDKDSLPTTFTTDLANVRVLRYIYIYRNGSLVWSGFVVYVVDGLQETSVYGFTWMYGLKFLFVRNSPGSAATDYVFSYTSQTSSYIIDDLHDRSFGGIAPITQGTLEDLEVATTHADQSITKTIFAQSFFEILTDFVNLGRSVLPESGWKQDSVFNVTFQDTARSQTFNFYRDVGVDKPEVVFTLDSEIVDFQVSSDLRSVITEAVGFGIDNGPDVLVSGYSSNVPFILYYGNRPFLTFQETVKDSTEHLAIMKDILRRYKDPLVTLSVKLAAGLVPFDGYSMGDAIKLIINKGRVSINDFYRVVGMEVSLAKSGLEITTPILQKKVTDTI